MDDHDALRKDAERYRALKARHAYLIVTRLIECSPRYSSATAPGLIDAYADAAVLQVRRFDAAAIAELDAALAQADQAMGSEG